MRIFKFIILLICLYGVKVHAQKGIQGQLKIDYVPASNYIRPIDSLKTDSKSDFKRIDLGIEIPLSMKMDHRGKPRTWSVLMQGAYASMENKNYEEELFPTELLNTQVGIKHFRSISESWSIMAMASVGVYTDLVKVDKEAILAQGGVFFIKHFNPRLALGVGPVLTNSFGAPMVLPGIYFSWETLGFFKLRIAFPEGMELAYSFTESFDLKLAVDLTGMTAVSKANDKMMLLGYQQITAGLRPELKLSNKLSLSLTMGSTLGRSFQFNERKIKSIFKTRDVADPKFSTTLYGAFALKWKL